MKFNDKSLAILKNFASINTQILLTPGKTIRTQSASEDMLAFGNISDTIPETCGIHDLNKFLGLLSLFTDPEISITEDHISISTDRQRARYMAAPASMIEAKLTEDYEFPGHESVKLSSVDLLKLLKGAQTLGHTEILFRGSNGVITVEGTNTKNPTDNSFSLELGSTDHTFKLYINKDRMLMLPRDYTVTFTPDMGIEFASTDGEVRYFIAYILENTDVGTLNVD